MNTQDNIKAIYFINSMNEYIYLNENIAKQLYKINYFVDDNKMEI